jgi:hypothetical protein
VSENISKIAVPASKEDVQCQRTIDKGLFPKVSAIVLWIILTNDKMSHQHADGAETEIVNFSMYWKETGEFQSGGIAQDALIMNILLLCMAKLTISCFLSG